MRLAATLPNPVIFYKITQALERLDKQWILQFSPTKLEIIILKSNVQSRNNGHATIEIESLFQDYTIESLHQNTIWLQLSGEHFMRAVKSGQNASMISMKLTKKGLPVLCLTISNQSRSGKFIQLVQDIPVRVLPPAVAETLSVLPRIDPDVILKCPSLPVMKTIVEKLKALDHQLIFSANESQLLLKTKTDTLSVQVQFKNLQLDLQDSDSENEYVEIGIDARDLLKIFSCHVLHPSLVTMSLTRSFGLFIEASLKDGQNKRPLVSISYSIPCM